MKTVINHSNPHIMSLIQKVASAMGEIAPLELADRSWDNVGTLTENPIPNGSGVVFLTNDLTPEVMRECVERKAEVIVAYHPPIFSGLKRLQLRDPKQKIVLEVVRHGMSVYSPHTSLDATVGGINDWLARVAGGTGKFTPIQSVKIDQSCPVTFDVGAVGYGRVAKLAAPCTLKEVVERVKGGLKLPHVRVAVPADWDSEHKVNSVAVCAGSGAGVFRALKSPVDVLLTGELSHHEVLAATASGQAVILCEHSNTERGYLTECLQPRLSELLGSDVSVIVSEIDKDPLSVW